MSHYRTSRSSAGTPALPQLAVVQGVMPNACIRQPEPDGKRLRPYERVYYLLLEYNDIVGSEARLLPC